MNLDEIIDRLVALRMAYSGKIKIEIKGEDDSPIPITAISPVWRNERSGRISDGEGKTDKRIGLIHLERHID